MSEPEDNTPKETQKIEVRQEIVNNEGEVVGVNIERAEAGSLIEITVNPTPPDACDQRNLAILREKVNQFWVKGVLEKSVYGEALIELGMKHQPEAVDCLILK